MPVTIPESLVRKASSFRDGVARGWLEGLPQTVEGLCSEWELTLENTFDYPSLSYIAVVRGPDGKRAVLKIGFLPDELSSEIDSLRAFGGRGSVRLSKSDKSRGALLVELIDPGIRLAESTSMSDDEKTSAAADLLNKLHRSAPSEGGFRSLEDWTSGLEKIRTAPFPSGAADQARRFRLDLLRSSPPPVLLHADFQHYNILSSDRGPWLAIDPKGIIGDPAYDAAPFLRNCLWNTGDPGKIFSRRLDIFSDRLKIGRERLLRWAVVDSVLSAWWCIEDTGRPGDRSLDYINLVRKY